MSDDMFLIYEGWIAHHAVEARRAFLDPVLVLDLPFVGVDEAEEHFGELDLPVEEAAVGTLGQRLDLGDQLPLLVVLRARRRSFCGSVRSR